MKHIYELHAEICKALASPKRIEIINALRGKEMSVSELLSKLKLRKANLSQHLAVMRAKGMVKTRREGVNIYYRIANPKIIRACDLMREVLFEQMAERKEVLRKWKQ